MYTGSMFGAGPVVFAVWGYAIANASRKGEVELNPKLLAAILGCTAEEVEAAIAVLAAPDPGSRSTVAEGRRLVQEGAYLYCLPTYENYRSLRTAEDRREYMRDYMRNRRAGKTA